MKGRVPKRRKLVRRNMKFVFNKNWDCLTRTSLYVNLNSYIVKIVNQHRIVSSHFIWKNIYILKEMCIKCRGLFFILKIRALINNPNLWPPPIYHTIFRKQDLLLMNGFCNYFLSCLTYSTKNSLYNCSALFFLVLLHPASVHVAEWKTKAVIMPQTYLN